jgi:uncharacterized protein YcsI (UPF0317 family)
MGADLDIRTDVPRYRIWRDGALVDEPTDIKRHWRDDLVTFVIGCSFSFEQALIDAGVPLRHMALGLNVAMYRTSVATEPAGRFHGPLVVSMRPLTADNAIRAVQITSRFRRSASRIHPDACSSPTAWITSWPHFEDRSRATRARHRCLLE